MNPTDHFTSGVIATALTVMAALFLAFLAKHDGRVGAERECRVCEGPCPHWEAP